MRAYIVSKGPFRRGTRLTLAPRLRADETLSSWLERLAGAYAMTTRDLLHWLGYPKQGDFGVARLDLDIHPPLDLSRTLENHSDTPAEEIEAHRLPEYGTLQREDRRTFCSSCWAEEGPYRRREWANSWSMICTRHRQLLTEKERAESTWELTDVMSWLELYESPAKWKTPRRPWEAEMWQEICLTLDVDAQVEWFRTWRWLSDLHCLGTPARYFPRIHPFRSVDGCQGDVRVKRDLTLYALINFRDRSLLKSFVPSINEFRLIQAGEGELLCSRTAADGDLRYRLLACIVGRHLWEFLTQGVKWHAGGVELERYLRDLRSSSAEEWWLEARIRAWPAERHAAARQLFRGHGPWLVTYPRSH